MKTNRRCVAALATATIAPGPTWSGAQSRFSACANKLCDKARRAAGLATKLLMLWLFALPLFAHAVAQIATAASIFGPSTSPNGPATAIATLPNVTVPGGFPSRLLVVTASNNYYGNVASVSFGTTAMTSAVQISSGYGSNAIWVLPLGYGNAVTADVRVTYNSPGPAGVSAYAYVSAVTFSGVDQVVPTSSPVIAAGQTGSTSIAVASAVGDLVYDVADFYSTLTAGPTVNVGAGQTQVAAQFGTVQFGTEAWRNSSEPGSPSVTMSWSSNANFVDQAAINIRQAPPADLTVTKTVQGNGPFVRGGYVSFDLTANNISASTAAFSVTVMDGVPTGLLFVSASGNGWTCTVIPPAYVSCELGNFQAILPNASSTPITILAYIKPDAPASITNTATVSGGGQTNTTNDSGSVTINTVPPADLTLTKVATGAFKFGGSASYTVTVTNGGGAATTNGYTVIDTLPTGLTAGTVTSPDAGWNCAASTSAIVSCSRSTALGVGESTTLNIPVNIAANAPASVTNTASVSGGGEAITTNNSGSATVTVTAPANYALNVTVTGGTWGSVVSTPAGINCPGTCAASFVEGTVVTLTRQVTAATDGEFVGWTDPSTCASVANSGNATCPVTMSAAKTAAARFTVTCRVDVDGDTVVRADTDALMITRSILGMKGASVITGAFNPGGTRTTEAAINAFIAPRVSENRYDVNLDGVTDWRDAAILLRAFSGFTGTAVTQGLITAGSQRKFWDLPTAGGATDGIKQYLNNRCAAAIP